MLNTLYLKECYTYNMTEENPFNIFTGESPEAEEARKKEERRKEKVALAKELCESHEVFPFPGINPEDYAKIKESESDPVYAEYNRVALIDDSIKRFESEGMKVVLGDKPENGGSFVLPAGSDDIITDSLLTRHLQINTGMNEKLKQLIVLSQIKR
jgi:hypothetical protein